MQAQTTKNMMALVRCLSPLRWFQCKELTITSYFNKFAADEKSNRNSAHCPSFVFVCADRRKKKKKRATFPACTATFISTDASADNLDQTVSGKTVSVYKEVTYLE